MVEQKQAADNIGTIVIGASICTQQQLDEAGKSCKSLNVPIERALVMLNFAGEHTMKNVIKADAMVREGKISVDTAVKGVRLARQNNMELEDAIGVIGQVHQRTQVKMAAVTNPLTELLLSTDMITQEQLGRAIQKARDTGMQMGRVLVLNRDLSSWMMTAALSALILVRDGKINKQQAMQGLLAVGRRRVSIEQALFELGLYVEKSGQTIKIGELIAMSGLISESDMLECLEIELIKEKQFGQILLEQGLVTHALLEAAIILQDMVGSGQIKAFQAGEALKQVRAREIVVYQALAELQPPVNAPQKELRPSDLLVESELVDCDTITGLIDPSEGSSIRVGKRVLAAGIISESFLYTALRTYSLFREGMLSADQAVTALARCKKESLGLDEALAKCGWIVPARMQWIWS